MSAERPSLKEVGSQGEKLLEEKRDLCPPFSPYKTGVIVTPSLMAMLAEANMSRLQSGPSVSSSC